MRPVSRVSFTLTDKAAFEQAIDQSVTWLGTKAGIALPSPARDRLSLICAGSLAPTNATLSALTATKAPHGRHASMNPARDLILAKYGRPSCLSNDVQGTWFALARNFRQGVRRA